MSFSSASIVLYADDMTLYFTGSNVQQLIHLAKKDLEKLYHLYLCNRLTINTIKTYFMLFSTKNTLCVQI